MRARGASERRVAQTGDDRYHDEGRHDQAVDDEHAVRVAPYVAEEPLDREQATAEGGKRSYEERPGPAVREVAEDDVLEPLERETRARVREPGRSP